MKLIKKVLYRLLSVLGLEKKRLAFPVFRYNIYSQDGDDGIIEFILNKVTEIPKYVIDIGANDGLTHSNSRLLIAKYEFGGLLIEPFEEAFKKLSTVYTTNNPKVTISNQAVGVQTISEGAINWHGHFSGIKMPLINVNELFAQHQVPSEIGFLSIDTDGSDNDILKAIDWRKYRPYFIIAEIDSSSFDKLQTQITIMDAVGYFPLFHIGNVFYYRKDKAGELLFNWKTNLKNECGLFKK